MLMVLWNRSLTLMSNPFGVVWDWCVICEGEIFCDVGMLKDNMGEKMRFYSQNLFAYRYMFLFINFYWFYPFGPWFPLSAIFSYLLGKLKGLANKVSGWFVAVAGNLASGFERFRSDGSILKSSGSERFHIKVPLLKIQVPQGFI